MKKRRPGTNPMTETRAEAEASVDKETYYSWIMDTLGDGQMTAHEIAREMHKKGLITTSARQEVAPRITELHSKLGLIDPVGKKPDFETGRNVAVFQRRDI